MNAQNFECLVTVDQRLPNQQNIAKSGISVLILRPNSNRRPDLEVLVPAALLVLSNIAPGEVRVVAATPT